MFRESPHRIRMSANNQSGRSRGGYVLLEALVAVLILSIGVVYLSRTMVPPLRASKICLHNSRAAEIAKSKVTEMRFGRSGQYTESGEIKDPDMIYAWRVEVGAESDFLRRVAIEVCWSEDGSERCYVGTFPILSITPVEPEKASGATE